MKFIILIFSWIVAVTFSYPALEDSYEYEDFVGQDDYSLADGKSTDQNYFQKVKNYMKNMKNGVKNSKFVQRCIKFNNTVEPETSDDYEYVDISNQTNVLKEPTREQKESCWDYLKNKGTKARKWFTGWFSTSKNESDSVNDDAELIKLENDTLTTLTPTFDSDKIYYPGYEDTIPTTKSPGFWKSTFG